MFCFAAADNLNNCPAICCKIHVLALNIDEAQHRDIQKVRENIYDLVDYLMEAGILHILAHPLYSVNDRLTVTHIETLLLLFKNFEMNGARNDQTNECLQHILRQLTPDDIDRLADVHGIAPRMEEPWRKNVTGAIWHRGQIQRCRQSL